MNDRCAGIRTAIAEILAGAPPSVDPETIERHLEKCPDCRAYREGLLRDDRLLNGFVKSADERLSLMEEKIMKSIDERIARPEASPKRERARRVPALFHSRFVQFAAAGSWRNSASAPAGASSPFSSIETRHTPRWSSPTSSVRR
jgi:hypothetical protein